jgi:ferritin-like metal-binding protein YciE
MNSAATAAARELFVAGLQNIHAIQKDAKSMMTKVIDRLDNYPEARERLTAHLADKDNEMLRAEQILESMGEKRSFAKDGAMSFMGGVTAAMTGAMDDDVLKSSMLTYGLANYEIAAYESLIVLGEAAGQAEAVPILKQSLNEERAMAEWLHEHLKPTLKKYLDLKAQGRDAAH